MNDPNGLVYYEGEYHLFYQYHPGSTVWGPMHWGHAISEDLVHWEQQSVALKPDHNGCIFSGSAVVDRNDTTGFFSGGSGLVAIFTHDDKDSVTGGVRQRQSLAYSLDKGRSWTKYAGNPVLEDARFTDFRDPKVFWLESAGRWVMVLAAGDRVIFYHSPNLIDWSFGSEFGADAGSHDGVWECPDLFELPVEGAPGVSRWVLIVSIGDNEACPEGSRTQYFVGTFDGRTFVSDNSPETILWLDYGRDNYAGVTWSDVSEQDGRRLLIGWMSNWKYAKTTPTEAWRSAMTLPRALGLRAQPEGIRVVQTPVEELHGLRDLLFYIEDSVIQPGDNPLGELKGDCLEIVAEVDLNDAAGFGFKVRVSGQEQTVIAYDVERRLLSIDRTNAGQADFHKEFGCVHGAELEPVDGRIKLRIFVDWSSVEVFAGSGTVVLTDLIFPDPASRGLELYSLEGGITVNTLSVYRMKSIW